MVLKGALHEINELMSVPEPYYAYYDSCKLKQRCNVQTNLQLL